MSTGNLSWATTRLAGEKGYMYHSGSWGVLVIFLGPLRDPLGRRGICIVQGAGEYW